MLPEKHIDLFVKDLCYPEKKAAKADKKRLSPNATRYFVRSYSIALLDWTMDMISRNNPEKCSINSILKYNRIVSLIVRICTRQAQTRAKTI